jgi:hypothetical protein
MRELPFLFPSHADGGLHSPGATYNEWIQADTHGFAWRQVAKEILMGLIGFGVNPTPQR